MSSPHFTPDIIAVFNLQADFMVLFMQSGMSEEVARDLAHETMHLVLTSRVVHPETKTMYETL